MAACFTEVPFYSLGQPELGSTITNSLSSERISTPQAPSKAARKERRGRGPVFVVSLVGLGSTARRPRQSDFFREATQIVTEPERSARKQRQSVLLLPNSEVHARPTNRVQTVEGGGVRAVGERIRKIRDGGPGAGSQVRAELRLEEPGAIRAGRGHDDIAGHVQGKDLARWRLGSALNINHAVKAVDRAYVVKNARKPIRWDGDFHCSGADVLRRGAGIAIREKRIR
jgi:hypothetical protein